MRRLAVYVTLGMALAAPGNAQDSLARFPGMVWRDELHFVTRPAGVVKKDWQWLLPVAGATAFLLSSDQRNMEDRIHSSPAAAGRAATYSNAWLGVLAAIPAFASWQGWRNRESYDEQTGWLAARAVADTLVSSEAIRLIARRERLAPQGTSGFFRSPPGGSAFPSLHAATAWSLAPILARRYPGWLTNLAVYGLATGVSASRVIGREHSPSDVFVGSALGYLIGRYVAGNDSGRPWYRSRPASRPAVEAKPAGHASTEYVPMDSWIYTALDRLAAKGYIPSQISGLRPWNRAECRRQAREAESLLSPAGQTARQSEALDLAVALRQEFADDSEAPALVLESIYVRNGVVAGPALNNSFHFGQTWIDDNGRPFGRGWNSDDGFTVGARAGRFFAYVDGEMQHAPGTPPLSLPVRQTFAALDQIPLQPEQPGGGTNRFRTVEAYAGVRVGDLEFSAGKQALWWGPTYDAPLSFSTNAEPTKNLKISTAHPVRLGRLGQVRAEFVMGKLGGQSYTWRPWFNALKVSFKLTKDLEMGFTRWSILWGVGHPITLDSFVRSFTVTNSPAGSSDGLFNARDPGDRKGGFDFRYRIPGVANWLTVYADSYCDDDPSPLAAPRRAAINPGIYLSHVPGAPKLDIRIEVPSTTPYGFDPGGNYNYFNNQYHSGNTNYGNLLGSWVGRDGRAEESWLGYSFSARTRIEASARQLKVSGRFLPGGSTQSDLAFKGTHHLGRGWSAGLFLQYEQFYVPLLGPRDHNFSGWIELVWEPKLALIEKRNQ